MSKNTLSRDIKETEILDKALDIIRQAGFPATVQSKGLLIGPNQQIDALITLEVGKISLPFYVEIKHHVSNAQQLAFMQKKMPLPGPRLLVAEQIDPSVCNKLRAQEIGFVDLNSSGFYLPITLEKMGFPQNEVIKSPTKKLTPYRPRIHTDSVVQLLFYFLVDPETLKQTQRQLAETVGVSPAAINRAIISLEKMGFLLQESNGKKIIKNRKELITRWSISFVDTYKQLNYCGRFKRIAPTSAQSWMQNTQLKDAVWGGEAAAAFYTHHLKPEFFTIYTRESSSDALNHLRLVASEDGDIELVKAFWDHKYDSKACLAPPLVVYADLIGSGYERNRETAKELYEQFKLGD